MNTPTTVFVDLKKACDSIDSKNPIVFIDELGRSEQENKEFYQPNCKQSGGSQECFEISTVQTMRRSVASPVRLCRRKVIREWKEGISHKEYHRIGGEKKSLSLAYAGDLAQQYSELT